MPENSILGIDLRVCSVKVAEIRKGPKGNVISGWGMEEVPYDLIDKHPEKEIAQAKALQKILSAGKIRTRKAVVVVGGGDVLVKKIILPLLSLREVRDAIKWKIKEEITYPLDEAVVDYIPLARSKGKDEIEYVISVAHRDTINRTLEVLRLAQVRLLSIVPVTIALAETYGEQLAEDKILALVYMGRRTTNIGFFKDRTFLFNREISIGGEDITRAMTSVVVSEEGRLELKYEEAEKIKTEYGIPLDLATYPKLGGIPTAQLQAVVRPALEKVEDEILRTIEYFKGQEGEVEISKVILCGGPSKTPHLPEFLSAGLGLKFEAIDPLRNVEIDTRVREKASLSLHSTQLSAAIGAALSHYVREVNLLPEEIRDRWKLILRRHLNPVELTAAFAVLIVLTYLFMFWQTFSLRAQIANVRMQIDQLRPRLARLEELERAAKEEEGRRGIFKTIELNRIKIPEVLEDVSLNMPKAVLMSEISIVESAREVRLRGTVFQREDTAENILSKFIFELSAAPSFKIVELVQAVKNENYQLEAFDFEISGKLKKKS